MTINVEIDHELILENMIFEALGWIIHHQHPHTSKKR